MKHKITIATLLIILALCLVGCKDNKTDQVTQNDTSDKDTNNEELKNVKDPIKISDQSLKIAIKKYETDDFTQVDELPQKLIFNNIDVIDKFEVNDVVIKDYAGIEWNNSSYICSFQLLIGDTKALFSFGFKNETMKQEDESIILESKYNLKTGYLDWDNHIVLLSYNKPFGEIRFDCYDCYGKVISNYQFDNYSNAKNFKMITADTSSFYLIYDKDNKKMIDTYDYNKDGIALVETRQLRDDIVNIYEDENTIFVEYADRDNRFIAICNRSFAVLDVIQIDNTINVENLKYRLDREECKLFLIVKIENKMYETEVPINNNYKKIYPYNILINEEKYNENNEYHYLIYDGYWIFENGIYKQEADLLDSNFAGTNYFKLDNGDIVKSNSEYSVCYVLEKPYNDVVRFMKIDDYYVGLNDSDEICYIDKEYKDRCINNNFIGEIMSYNNVYFNELDDSITYINGEENTVYTITSDREKKAIITIPEKIWNNFCEEIYNDNLNIGYDKDGIGFIGYHVLYYYSFNDKKFHIINTEREINYKVNIGYTCTISGITNILDNNTYEFKPYYINKKDIYDTMNIDDMFYINMPDEYSTSVDEKDYVVYHSSEYVPYKTTKGEYKLSQLKSSKSHTVFKEYITNQLYDLTEKECKRIMKDPVRLYSITDDGILYSGYEEQAYLYYYDYKTCITEKIYDDSYISDLALINGYAYYKTVNSDKLYRINIENKKLQYIEIKESNYNFESSNDYLAINSEEDSVINIIDLNEFKVIDKIDGTRYKWDQDILYYDCKGYMCKYNPKTKESIIMEDIKYPIIQAIHNNYIYYLISYDGPLLLDKISLDQVYKFENNNSSIDYYVMKDETPFYSHLLLYNNKTKRLESLIDAEEITYELKDNVIKYKGKSHKNESDWEKVKVEKGSDIVVQEKKH